MISGFVAGLLRFAANTIGGPMRNLAVAWIESAKVYQNLILTEFMFGDALSGGKIPDKVKKSFPSGIEINPDGRGIGVNALNKAAFVDLGIQKTPNEF